jgi:type III pantothenate kinase
MPRSRRTPSPALLLVDAGNTRTKIGLFDAAPPVAGELPVCRREWVLEDDAPPNWEEISRELGDVAALRLCLTGSNPRRVAELRGALPSAWPPPRELPPRRKFPLLIEVDFPEKVGIDRLLNAMAANQLRRVGQAAVVISSGTATTVDYMSPSGAFCGGAILPGFELSARALHEYTALLPLIPLDVVLEAPPDEIGRNTQAALQSGLYWGHVGSVRELLRRFLHRATVDQQAASEPAERHLGNITADELPLVLLTGGGGPLLQPHLAGTVRLEPHLPLQGLALLCQQCGD